MKPIKPIPWRAHQAKRDSRRRRMAALAELDARMRGPQLDEKLRNEVTDQGLDLEDVLNEMQAGSQRARRSWWRAARQSKAAPNFSPKEPEVKPALNICFVSGASSFLNEPGDLRFFPLTDHPIEARPLPALREMVTGSVSADEVDCTQHPFPTKGN